MRLFVAIELSEPAREHLADLCGGLRFRLSIVPAQNLHVTVTFLGDVKESSVPSLTEALHEAWRELPAGAARVWADRAELLPTRGPVRVVAVGLGGDVVRVREVHRSVEEACERNGLPRESREYLPHITLARARQPLAPVLRDDMTAAISRHLPGPEFEVRGFTLFESRLGSGPPEYIPLARFGS